VNPYLLGIEIGGTKLQCVLGHPDGRIEHRLRLPVNPTLGADGIRQQLASFLAQQPRPTLTGVGVGFGGPVDHRLGRICCSHQIQGWSNCDLRSWLTHQTDAPVTIENDANTAALGEALLGAGRGLDPVFYVTLGSGVGGGFVCQQQIYHGQTPGEAEIGHLRLDRSGTILEDRCSGWAVNRRILQTVATHPNSPLARLTAQSPGHEARHLSTALAQNDPLARQLLDELADDLAFALSHLTHLLHPQVVILGGGLSKVGSPLLTSISQRLPRYLMTAFHPGPKITLAALGEDAVPTGALLLAAAAANANTPHRSCPTAASTSHLST